MPEVNNLTQWRCWLAFPRSFLAGLFLLVSTAIFSCAVLLYYSVSKNPRFGNWIVKSWSWSAMKVLGLTVMVEGLEHLKRQGDQGVIYVFNHTSHLDILVMHHVLPSNFRFGAKSELFKIPIFGTAMKRAGALPIVRRDRAQVLKLYEDSVARLHRGHSFALAPEGGRQSGKELGAFKKGPFYFAIHGQVDVVPVVLSGVHRVLSKKDWLPGWRHWGETIKVEILPPFSTQGLKEEDLSELGLRVEAAMRDAYQPSVEKSS